MAYRAPRFSYVHAAREVGAAAITLDGDTADADFPVDNLIDDRAGTLFKFSASFASPLIIVDLGAGFDTGLTRIIIPSNHNITSFRVIEDDNVGLATFATLLGVTAATPGTLIDETITASAERYIALQMQSTDLFFLPQLVFSKVVTIGAGPNLADATDEMRANVARQNQPTGLSPTVQLGPQQRFVEYNYDSPLDGADLTAMELLVATVGMSFPFFVDPASFSTPPETDEPVLWMKFAEMPSSRNTILVPMSNARSKAYQLRLIESLD